MAKSNKNTENNKQSAADRKNAEIARIVTKREALRSKSSVEELRAEVASLEQAILASKQAAMITELCKVQEDNDFLLKLRN